MEETCIFCRIVKGSIPARIAFEDDETLAFHDVDPRAPVPILIVARKHIPAIDALQPEDAGAIGQMFVNARNIARECGVADSGYRLVINNGADAGQSVDHIHLHLLGGRPLRWPPG